MVWRKRGDKSLCEPMLALFTEEYMPYEASVI